MNNQLAFNIVIISLGVVMGLFILSIAAIAIWEESGLSERFDAAFRRNKKGDDN